VSEESVRRLEKGLKMGHQHWRNFSGISRLGEAEYYFLCLCLWFDAWFLLFLSNICKHHDVRIFLFSFYVCYGFLVYWLRKLISEGWWVLLESCGRVAWTMLFNAMMAFVFIFVVPSVHTLPCLWKNPRFYVDFVSLSFTWVVAFHSQTFIFRLEA